MEGLYEVVKAIGAALGIFSAAFLLWDRYVKHFPVAIIVPRPLMEGSREIMPFVYLRNVSDRPVLISWENGVEGLRVAKAQTVEGVVETLFEGRTTISLGPQAEAYLPLFQPSNRDEIADDNMMEMEMKWRFAQPRIWRADRRLPVSIRKSDLQKMIDGYLDQE